MRDPTSENDYLSDDRMPGGGAQASAVLHDIQQDVRLESSQAHSYKSMVAFMCVCTC